MTSSVLGPPQTPAMCPPAVLIPSISPAAGAKQRSEVIDACEGHFWVRLANW